MFSEHDLYNYDPVTYPTQETELQGCKIEWTYFPTQSWRRLLTRLRGHTPTVIYLHGINDPFQNHLDILRLVNLQGYDVYALNLPGHGRSGLVPSISWSVLCGLVEEFAANLSLRRVILLGYSMGGGITLQLLQRNKLQISEVKLIAPFCYSVPVFNAETVRSIATFSSNLITRQLAMRDKRPRLIMINAVYIQTHYPLMFTNFSLDLSKNRIPIRATVLGQDELIDPQKAKVALSKIANIRIDELPEQTHDIFYVTNQQTKRLVDKLFD